MTALPVDLDIDGAAAPPRSNGELVFAEPWQSRIFGVTVSMHEAGYFEWPAFQAELISAISGWEASSPDGAPFDYYACWLRAFEALLDSLGLLEASRVRTRITEHRARPAGHDHGHGAGHHAHAGA